MAVHTIVLDKTAGAVTALPGLSGTFLVLLGISSAGYVGGKMPQQHGTPTPSADEPPASGSAVPAQAAAQNGAGQLVVTGHIELN
jgi:hypothetical protein